jgi:hypothetical protein
MRILLAVSSTCWILTFGMTYIEAQTSKEWHPRTKKSDLWGLKEIPYELYERVKIGGSYATIESNYAKKGEAIACHICWKARKSFEVCFRVRNGVITDKSIKEVKLQY